ncbi:MAG TPA: hypothetical protein VM582_05565 [Candidatus Thermoplasmatota archaeon]|nr:hypothetical protein [Candidatus Thermoplasmatota archaeon]
MLHVLDGDALAPVFERARLPGRAVVFREALLEGPWPRPLRGVDEALAAIERAAGAGDEVVLWQDEDLFCRLNAAFLAHTFPHARFTNAVGSHADRADLARLLARRVPLDARLAAAWRAYAADDPRALVPLARELLWLRLHLERFPHARDGLDALERRILGALRDHGPLPFPDLYRRVATGDFAPARFGLTDAAAQQALLALVPLAQEGPQGWSLGAPGRDVLEGRADRLALAPLERFLGGVRLRGSDVWRWDGERLVPPSSRKP